MKKSILLATFALALITGCGGEDRSIRFIRWTPRGILFVRSGKLFLWNAEADTVPTGIGDWVLKEERFSLSPDGGKIAVVPDREKVWNIWEVDLPGGEGTKITDSIYKDYFPVYDPSGNAVYFISYRGGRPDIWRVRLDDLSTDKLTDDEDEEEGLAISPDGGTLLYAAAADDGTVALYALDTGAGSVEKLADGLADVSSLRFSPAGDRFVYCSGGGLWMGDGGGEPSRIADADFAAWDGGGKTLLYCAGGDIWRRSFGIFGRSRRLTRSAGIDANPSPSIDGKRVAYCTGPGKSPELLTVVGSSFSPETRVWCPTDMERIDAFYRANGRPGEAARYFSSIIDGSGSKKKIARLIADDYLRAGKYRRAIAVLREHTRDGYEIGKIYMYYLRDFSRAMEYFKEAGGAREELMLLYASTPGLLREYCRGWVDIQEEKYEKGIERIDGFLERSGRLKALEGIYYMRAEVYDRKLYDAGKAIRAYREALAAWPDNERAIPARVRLAELYEKAGELPEALGLYRSVVSAAGGGEGEEKALAYASILRITLREGRETGPLLREVGAAGKTCRAEFANEAVRALDAEGEHGEANRIVRTALLEWGLEPGDLAEALSRSLSSIDASDLLMVRLEKLPSWFKERLGIIASSVDPELASPVGGLLEGASSPGAGRIVEVVEILRRVLKLEGEGLSALEAFEDYVLGNVLLNEGNVKEAVYYLKRLCRDDFAYYYQQLSCCAGADPEEAGEWLELERKYAFSFWGAALDLIDVTSGRKDLFSGGDERPRSADFVGEYEAFISKHPGSPLAPAFAARVASALPERERKRALLKILAGHKGGCISIPFSLLFGEYIDSGNYGLALAMAEPLARSSGDPAIKYAVAGLLSDVGGEREALPFLWDISINYTESPEWAGAQEKLIYELASSGKEKSALLMLDELVDRRPASEPVLSGKARLLRMELLAKLGRVAEAATAAEAMISEEDPRLDELPGRMTAALARFMFEKKREVLVKLHTSVGPEERAVLEEMVPHLRKTQ